MRKKIEYFCPKDLDIVLYVEHVDSDHSRNFHFLIPERPKTCPNCKISYYKNECPSKETQA